MADDDMGLDLDDLGGGGDDFGDLDDALGGGGDSGGDPFDATGGEDPDDLIASVTGGGGGGGGGGKGGAPAPAPSGGATMSEALGIPSDRVAAVYDIPVQISAVLGKASMQVSQLLKLGRGAVVELDRKVGEPIDIYVNNRLVARGEVVVVDDRLGVTITEVIRREG